MAGPNNINIVISLKNQASDPLKKVRKDVKDFREELVMFNRRLFTATAVYATFQGAFTKAFDIAAIGADFDFFRQQFDRTFSTGYLTTLRNASHGTMDAMSMMQIAVQNHARGLKDAETQKIFTLSVGAAKLLGTSTADAAKQMSRALQTLSQGGMQNFLVALNTNNQFKNMNLLIRKLTKGLNAAGMETALFRKTALRELEIALGEVSAQTGDAKELFMAWGAGLQSFRQILGSLLSRAIAPFIGQMARLTWDIFDKLNVILDNTNKGMKNLRQGLVDFVAMGGGALAMLTALTGGLSLMALLATTLGVTFGGVVGLVTLFTIGIKKFKDESGSFTQMLADMGTALKFFYQAFTTYDPTTGKMKTTTDMMERLGKMSPTMRNAVVFIGEGFAIASVGIKAFYNGLKDVFGLVTKLLTTFGLFNSSTKQFSQSGESLAKGIGYTAGILGGIYAMGRVGSLAGGMLGKIPGVNKIFGGGGKDGLFSRGTLANPMYTKSVDGIGGLGGAGGLAGNIGKAAGAVGVGGVVAGSLALAAAGTAALVMKNMKSDTESKAENLAFQIKSMKNAGGQFTPDAEKALQVVGPDEYGIYIKKIHEFLETHRPNAFVTTKPNMRDQIVR